MKLLALSFLLGSALAAVPEQHVLHAPKPASDAWAKPLHTLKDTFKTLSADAQALWDEMAVMFPEATDKLSFFSSPKKHTRRPDSHWEHITRGADIQDIWIKNEDGQKEREVGGRLEAYNLRTKTVDTSILGVDPDVKQFSGYLDDEENDKHLFYCKLKNS